MTYRHDSTLRKVRSSSTDVDGRSSFVRRRIFLSSFRFRSRCERRRIVTYDVGAAVDNHDDKKNAPREPRNETRRGTKGKAGVKEAKNGLTIRRSKVDFGS